MEISLFLLAHLCTPTGMVPHKATTKSPAAAAWMFIWTLQRRCRSWGIPRLGKDRWQIVRCRVATCPVFTRRVQALACVSEFDKPRCQVCLFFSSMTTLSRRRQFSSSRCHHLWGQARGNSMWCAEAEPGRGLRGRSEAGGRASGVGLPTIGNVSTLVWRCPPEMLLLGRVWMSYWAGTPSPTSDSGHLATSSRRNPRNAQWGRVHWGGGYGGCRAHR